MCWSEVKLLTTINAQYICDIVDESINHLFT